MTARDENAPGCEPRAREQNQRQVEFKPYAGTPQQIPHKWKRVLAALLAGHSFNRFTTPILRCRYRLARLVAPCDSLFNAEMSLIVDRQVIEIERLRAQIVRHV